MNFSVGGQEKLKVILMKKNETDTNVGQRGMRWQEVTAISPTSANARQNFQANTFFDVDKCSTKLSNK